ncbi:hypothetical protein [Psychrobacter sp. AOP31-A1-22]|uniref:hypothetical protein n=1 Tax=Psychrobacter sp. AOP31-A1-22 TaxID=3457696 RepID=UPI004035F9B8
MFNLFEMFNKDDPVALSIAPSLRFISVGREIKVVVDSGEEDLNHRVSQSRLDEKKSSAINRLFITGFDKIYTGFDTALLKTEKPASIDTPVISKSLSDDSVAAPNATAAPIDIREPVVSEAGVLLPVSLLVKHLEGEGFAENELSHQSKKVKALIEDAFEHEEGIMFGEVCLELDNGESYVIANPVYTVLPAIVDDELEFVETAVAQDYIESEWQDEFAEALIAMADGGESAGMPAREPRSRNKESDASPARFAKYLVAVIAASLVAVAAYAGYGWVKGDTANEGYSAFSQPADQPLYAQTASSASTGSANLQNPTMPSPEDYAALQTRATEDMLKKMNVDITNTADLGCLTN